MADSPLQVSTLTNLTQVDGGLAPTSIRFSNISMESDKYVCVRDTAKDAQGKDQNSIVIVEIGSESRIKPNNRYKMGATEAAAMNPASKVLALKAQSHILIFNLDMQMKIKSTEITEGVVFMKWISPQQLALVTPTAVYHWSMEGDAQPQKVFNRREEMAQCQIINYRVDSSLQWLLLIGIGAECKGMTQIHAVAQGADRIIDGHAACFTAFKRNGTTFNLMCIASSNPQGGSCFIAETPPSGQFDKVNVQVSIGSQQDFPVGMQANDKMGVLYMVMRSGLVHVLDVERGFVIHSQKVVDQENVFMTTKHTASGGSLFVTSKGEVKLIQVNENNIVSWVQQRLQNPTLALRIATSADLGGADDLFLQKFNMLLQSMQIEEAIKVCCEAPRQMLRTPEVLQRLQSIPPTGGQPPAETTYFKYMIEHSKLNKFESVELAKKVLARQGGIEFFKKYLEEKKLEESEELGDVVAQHDSQLALQIYFKGKAHLKVINQLVKQQQWSHVVKYIKQQQQSGEWSMEYQEIISRILQMGNADGASAFAQQVANDPDTADKLDHNQVVEMFVQRSFIKQATAYLLEVLKENKPEHAALQTKLLEINLMYSPPQVADQILNLTLSHYDALKVAQLCERVNLYQRALENFNKVQRESETRESTLRDIKRCIVNTHVINQEWLCDFFLHLSREDALACLQELMANNMKSNWKICTQVAIKNYEQLGTDALMDLFLQYRAFEALYLFLGTIVRPRPPEHPEGCTDPEVHYRYIEACVNVQQFAEVQRMARESAYYPPEKTKNFLKEKRLQDLWPFIHVCDKHDYIDEMVRFLYDTKNLKYIDMYVQKLSPAKTPQVVGSLLDVDCDEAYIKNLIISVGSMAPLDELVTEVEKRGRLKILQPWLEARQHTSQEPALYNALAKIYVDTNQGAKKFLEDNAGKYDALVVGKFCENRDPNLSVMAYEKGGCDKELIDVTAKNGMFKQQARYLVQKQDPELWAYVLETEEREQHRKNVIDAVVATALPEAKKPEEVSATVKAFMAAQLPEHLTTLLEKIVLHSDDKTEFRNNRYLQNLLILTAVKSTPKKVMDYIQRLENYDATSIADIASKAGLHEEAYTIYKKQGMHPQAIEVLLQNIQNLQRARDYAEKVSIPEVWTAVGRAELLAGEVSTAIQSFIKADDASAADMVVNAVRASGTKDKYQDLVKYLQMARSGTKQKSEMIDTELCYALAVTGRHADLEEFLGQSHLAKVADVGQRCFQEKLYDAAKICFQAVSNFPALAKTLVKLGQFQAAIEAAQRAGSVTTWKQVCHACVDAKEFRLANMAAQHIIIVADELDEIIHFFEARGCWEELINLLKQGLQHQQAHMGMFTELGILYAKYKPEKLIDHMKVYKNRFNSHKLVLVCEKYHHWAEIRYLHTQNEEWDAAAQVMMDHSVQAWDHEIFKDVISKVSSLELCYNGIGFYLEEHPEQVNDLLTTLIKRVDPERVVSEVSSKGRSLGMDFIAVIRPYLETVQELNKKLVNNALNRIYISEEDYESLRRSLEQYDAVDQLEFAEELESHDLLEMRRVASWLYKSNKKYKKALELSKRDKLYQDAMIIAADSKNKDMVDDLLRFFTDEKLHECFAACLFTCYEYIQPDVALELAWRHNIYDFAMPYIIQVLREYVDKIDDVSNQLRDAKEQAEKLQSGGGGGQQHISQPLMIQSQPMASGMYSGAPMHSGMMSGMGYN